MFGRASPGIRPTTIPSFSGTTGCYSVGYSENSNCFYSFSTANPQQVTARFTGSKTGGNDYGWYFSDADSSEVYFACPSTELTGTNLFTRPGAVCKFNPATATAGNFTSGTTLYQYYHPFTNGILVGTQPSISGLAVQKSPGSSIYQYSNLSTTPALTATITGSGTTALAKPLSIAVSPANAPQPNLLLVTDGGSSQQVKAYNMSGAWQWTFGQPNGYTDDPAVTTDKFWFNNPEAIREQASIAFEPDGTFWIVDCMNCRVLHYQLGATAGAVPVYQNQFAFINRFYTNAVDKNNPTRLFASTEGKWLEFAVDYSKPLGGTNGSWTLVRNWGHAAPVVSNTSYTGFTTEGFRCISTLSNGRTYALAYNRSSSKESVIELPATGQLRLTGSETSSSYLYPDGSLRYQSRTNNINTFGKQSLSGFNASGNPIWSGSTTLATAPGVAGIDLTYESNGGGPRLPITSSNILVFFDHTKNAGMHLGGIDLNASTTQWAWEAAPATGMNADVDPQNPLWGDGSYDAYPSIQYGGGLHDALGRNILYQYKGEFWNNSEANQLMHFYDNGLFVGQFGTPNSVSASTGIIPAGAAGNMMMGTLVLSNTTTYFYTNDENQHGGYHRWRLDGLDTIGELAGSGALNSTINLAGTAPIGTAQPLSDVPGPVGGIKTYANNGSVYLQWTGTNAVYYQVRRSTAPNNGFEIIATGLGLSCYTDVSATNGTTYYYIVVGVNGSGPGPTASQVAATPSTVSPVYEAEAGVLSGSASIKRSWAGSG